MLILIAPVQLIADQLLLGMADSPGSKDSLDFGDAQTGEEEGKPDGRRLRVLEYGQLQVEPSLPAGMAGN